MEEEAKQILIEMAGKNVIGINDNHITKLIKTMIYLYTQFEFAAKGNLPQSEIDIINNNIILMLKD